MSRIAISNDNLLPSEFVVCPTTKHDGTDNEHAHPNDPHFPALDAKPEEHGPAKRGDGTEKIEPSKLCPGREALPDDLSVLLRLIAHVKLRHRGIVIQRLETSADIILVRIQPTSHPAS